MLVDARYRDGQRCRVGQAVFVLDLVSRCVCAGFTFGQIGRVDIVEEVILDVGPCRIHREATKSARYVCKRQQRNGVVVFVVVVTQHIEGKRLFIVALVIALCERQSVINSHGWIVAAQEPPDAATSHHTGRMTPKDVPDSMHREGLDENVFRPQEELIAVEAKLTNLKNAAPAIVKQNLERAGFFIDFPLDCIHSMVEDATKLRQFAEVVAVKRYCLCLWREQKVRHRDRHQGAGREQGLSFQSAF